MFLDVQLARNLPPRTIGYPWTLAFGTSKHGMSIKSLYRAMQGQDTPVLMVIKDSDGQVRAHGVLLLGRGQARGLWVQQEKRTPAAAVDVRVERVCPLLFPVPGVRSAGLRAVQGQRRLLRHRGDLPVLLQPRV